ncbi:hypothetical protein COLO4_26103 [Corchorus olitorius]|uniref:Uncharacterized protein n=1 Tax=Corchorus olitorius TaxID=93759 RepID=A0A1R3HYQ8_9ROSI|nr:hypothetical protein COLO4_26103 [Corchorus olitorius]
MSRGRKMIQTKLKSGGSKELGSNLSGKTNVNEEYKEAFRTKSYVEMWSQVLHGQLEKTSLDRLSSSASIPYSINLSEYLLQPRQETLDKIEDLNFDHLLLDYFEAGLEACNLCELLLGSIHQTRVYYQRIRKIIKLSKKHDWNHSRTWTRSRLFLWLEEEEKIQVVVVSRSARA